jgi:hypothetical protein
MKRSIYDFEKFIKEAYHVTADKFEEVLDFIERHKEHVQNLFITFSDHPNVDLNYNGAKRFKDFVKQYNGVATKYLQSYLNLFRFIELFKKQRSMISEFYHASLSDKLTLSRYSNLEERYQLLIA